MEVHITVIAIFDLLCSYDLDFDLKTFIYELDLYCLNIHRMCKSELPTSRLSTDRQTSFAWTSLSVT